MNKINLTCDQKNDEDRIAVYKRLNDTYYKVMINIKENEIPLENSAWPENVPEVLEETFINGEDRVTRSDDSTSIHLSYVDSEEDREPFLKMMVESLD